MPASGSVPIPSFLRFQNGMYLTGDPLNQLVSLYDSQSNLKWSLRETPTGTQSDFLQNLSSVGYGFELDKVSGGSGSNPGPHITIRATTGEAGSGTGRGVIQFIDDQSLIRFSIEAGGQDQKFKIYTNDGSTLQTSLRITSGASPRTVEIVSGQNIVISGDNLYFRDTGEGSFIGHDGSNFSLVIKTGNTQLFSSDGASGNALRMSIPSGATQGLTAGIQTWENLSPQTVGGKFSTIQLPIKAGVPADADFINPVNGLLAIDSSDNKIYVRIGGSWKGVVVA